MKVQKLQKVIREMPRFVARFTVTRVPNWAKYIDDPLALGEPLDHYQGDTYVRIGADAGFIRLGASNLKFVRYVQVTGELMISMDAAEEMILDSAGDDSHVPEEAGRGSQCGR